MPGFEVDERKLQATIDAQPRERTLEDDVQAVKMVSLISAGPLLLLLAFGLLVWSLLSLL